MLPITHSFGGRSPKAAAARPDARRRLYQRRAMLIVLGIVSGLASVLSLAFYEGACVAWLKANAMWAHYLCWHAGGLIYCCVVIAPWSRMCRMTPAQTAGGALLGASGYVLARWVYTGHSWLSPWAGGIGAAVMLAPAFSQASPRIRRAALATVAAGATAGLLVVLPSFISGGKLWLLVSIALWQAATAVTLSWSLGRISTDRGTSL